MHHIPNDSRVWMLTGTGNNLRYVDLTKIHTKLGDSIYESLPGFHAITGKLGPYKILITTEKYQKAFIKFGDTQLFEDDSEIQSTFDIIQQFICDIYNVGTIIDVDAARLQLFINNYTVCDVNEAFQRKKICNFDGNSLPPCKSELFQQFRRANYISSIWNNAHKKIPSIHEPANNGWVQVNSQYNFKWFEGDQLPNFVSDALQTISETNEEDDTDNEPEEIWCSSDEEYEENYEININNESYVECL
ncbi:uncharacterized protein LOC125779446 [Bactrocera dorsalis]|uniref:Uncharacterized protein LOC125779446 n=1 Tax=Bactrocera dorsalis TaxID=27457 RepID=A0ABM3K5M2_BACDO|nr:uncharacterized protein LOC125779446 [Bactrocera dorsalis]